MHRDVIDANVFWSKSRGLKERQELKHISIFAATVAQMFKSGRGVHLNMVAEDATIGSPMKRRCSRVEPVSIENLAECHG